MAKKILPIYLDKKERTILQALAQRDGVSMGEAARRMIRSYQLTVEKDPASTADVATASDAH